MAPSSPGKDLEAAVYATEELEETAKLRLLLHGLNPRLLTRAQVSDLVDHFGLDEAIGENRPRMRHGSCSAPHATPISADKPMPRFSANLGFLFTDRPEIERVSPLLHAGFRAVEMHWPYQVPAADMREP